MANYDLDYAQEHLTELFHTARNGAEVVIVREDGRACELTPLAEVWAEEALEAKSVSPARDPEPDPGDLVPA